MSFFVLIMINNQIKGGHQRKIKINSHTNGMAVARAYGFEIDYVRNPISG